MRFGSSARRCTRAHRIDEACWRILSGFSLGLRWDTTSNMSDFASMARDPEHRRRFEKLLYLAAKRGDADLVAERLSWGIDPNCTFAKGRTPLIANVRGSCPSAATVRALLEHGADPGQMDESGLT